LDEKPNRQLQEGEGLLLVLRRGALERKGEEINPGEDGRENWSRRIRGACSRKGRGLYG